MRENVLSVPALQIEHGPRRQEFETSLRQARTTLTPEHGVEMLRQPADITGRALSLRPLGRICRRTAQFQDRFGCVKRQPEAAEALREAQRAPEPGIVVGVSAAQARAWSPLVRFDRVIRNGVPVGLIPWLDQPGEGLIFAGRLSAEKGAATAIEIALLAGDRIDVYGAGYDEDYARGLRERYEGEPRVTFHEPLPRAELWPRLASARAVLCPSEWDEPFGLVAAEAQAAGTPVVAFSRGGLTEVIDEAVTGFLVEPGNVAAAAEAVGSVTTLDRRRCRQHAVDDLDLETCVAGYEALYASVSGLRAPADGLAGNR